MSGFDIVMEILKKYSSKDNPLSTRMIKELSNGRLQGHRNPITPMLKREANKGTVIQLKYTAAYDGYRYYLPG